MLKLSCALVAMETVLRWTLVGKLNDELKNDSHMTVLSLYVNNRSICDLEDVDTIGILEFAYQQSQKELEKETEELLLNSAKQDESRRYIVSLSWLEDHPALLTNKNLVEKRLKSSVDKIKDLDHLCQRILETARKNVQAVRKNQETPQFVGIRESA
ncbi:hypothetical protein HNY73_000026 [Argiope bruennichi]|uniref:Uncharacterized protein n=1 Tax=Argiope bruennichi TaxID=94029 RepID=A0A8T0FZ44_ARGBR|nr:hypothetical protein HNY73_000026 [Argiope bruennichi]